MSIFQTSFEPLPHSNVFNIIKRLSIILKFEIQKKYNKMYVLVGKVCCNINLYWICRIIFCYTFTEQNPVKEETADDEVSNKTASQRKDDIISYGFPNHSQSNLSNILCGVHSTETVS